jgi:hypothetical protein
MNAPDRAAGTSIFLRPIASPVALGLSGLVVASLVVSGLELGWVASGERTQVALVLLALPFPLQFTASVIAFLGRDAAAATALGVLAGTWLATSLVWLASPPGSVSGALGLALLAAAGLLAGAGATVAARGGLPGVVFLVEALRFALSGIYELSGSEFWQDAAGVVGLAVVALAGFAMLTVLVHEARVSHIDHEPGVREQL